MDVKVKARVEHGTDADVENFIEGNITQLSEPPLVYYSDTAKNAMTDWFSGESGFLPAGDAIFSFVNVPCGETFALAQVSLEIANLDGGCPNPPYLDEFELNHAILLHPEFENGQCTYYVELSLADFTCIGCTS